MRHVLALQGLAMHDSQMNPDGCVATAYTLRR